jgi:hypothetical protein
MHTHGGRRANSGAKRGSIYAPTWRKRALLVQWQERVSREFDRVILAELRAALGTSYVFARGDNGRWAHVPDPDAMTRERLQAGQDAYCLTAIAPNHAALKQVLDRLLGTTRQALEVPVEPPSVPMLSDGAFAVRLTALTRQLRLAPR